jgi:hypothetical protein
MVPLAARDYARVREAAALRGPGAAPVGRAAMVRRLVAGSLDRSVDVAATLELRGYAHGAPRRADARPVGRHSARFAVAGGCLIALTVAARLAGVGEMDSYPAVAIDADTATLAFALAIPLLAALPFASAAGVGALWRPARA